MESNLIILFHFFNFSLGLIGLIIISRRVSLVNADIQKSFILQALFYNITIIISAVVDFQDFFFWSVVKEHIAALTFVYFLTILNLASYILWVFFFIQMVYKVLNMSFDLTAKSWFTKTAAVIASYLLIILAVRISRLYPMFYPISAFIISFICIGIVLAFSIYLIKKAGGFSDINYRTALKVLGILFTLYSLLVLFVDLDYIVLQILPQQVLRFSVNAADLFFNVIIIFWAFKYLDFLSVKEEPIPVNSASFEMIASKYQISKRELEVVSLVCEGKSNQEIADILFISLGTVKNHLYNIYSKIGIKNRTQLAKLFQ